MKEQLCLSYLDLSFKQCLFLHNMAAPPDVFSKHRHNAKTSSNSLPQLTEKANVCSVPSLLVVPPSATFFLILLSLTPSPPPPASLSLSFPISIANFSCVVYPHVRAWLNAILGLRSWAQLPVCFTHVSCLSGGASLCTDICLQVCTSM